MKPVGKAAVLAVAASVIAGCRVELSQSNVGRIVETVLQVRRSSPSYRMEVQAWMGEGEGKKVIDYAIEKDSANGFSYSFGSGMRYWSSADGCVLVSADGERAEVFSGLREPTEPELREALRWGASRFLTRHKVIAHLNAEEGPWKGHRISVTPAHPNAYDSRSEYFADKRTGAKVFSIEFGEQGEPVRRRLARSVRVLGACEFRKPRVPDGCSVTSFASGSGSDVAPGWSLAPEPAVEVLASPRGRHSDGLAVYDMSKGGFVFVLFERRAAAPPLTSPTAHVADVAGKRVSAWPVGEKFMYRWRDGGLDFSLLGNVPPDVAWDFLVANVGPGGPLASRAQTADAAAGAKAAP